MSALHEPPPARPMDLAVQFERVADRLSLRYRRPGSAFLILLLFGWLFGVGGLLLCALQFHSFTPATVGVSIGAILWVRILVFLIQAVLQSEELSITAAGARFTQRVPGWQRTTDTPLPEIAGFRSCEQLTDSETSTWEFGIEMQKFGSRPVRFAYGVLESERLWLCSELNGFLTQLNSIRPGNTPIPEVPAIVADDRATEIIANSPDPVGIPGNSQWSCRHEIDDIVSRQSGRFEPPKVKALLALSTFVNGGISVLAWHALTGRNRGFPDLGLWALCAILLPVAYIGIGAFVLLLTALVEPFRRGEWRLEGKSLTCRWNWFGLGKVWNFRIDRLDRMEQRFARCSPTRQWKLCCGKARYAPALVDSSNTDVCVIDGLTDDEVRWFADVIHRKRGRWFAKWND